MRISRIRLSDQVHSEGMHVVIRTRLAFRHSFRCSVWIFSGVSRLIVNHLDPVLLRPHPGTRAPSLHRNYPASPVLRAPPPPAPARRPTRLLATLATEVGFPCCPSFLADMLSPTTPAKRAELVVRTLRSVPAFPQSRQGRPSHRVFRGRLGVHSRYGLPACRQPEAASFLPGFSRFVASTTARIATRPGRPLPGQDFHLLEQRTFARRTWTPTPVWAREKALISCACAKSGLQMPEGTSV